MSPFSVPCGTVRFITLIKHTRTTPARENGKRRER